YLAEGACAGTNGIAAAHATRFNVHCNLSRADLHQNRFLALSSGIARRRKGFDNVGRERALDCERDGVEARVKHFQTAYSHIRRGNCKGGCNKDPPLHSANATAASGSSL